MILKLFTDGGSLNNPGQAAYAFIIYKDSLLVTSRAECIGIATNNVAEYTGLIKGLEEIKRLLSKIKNLGLRIEVYSDSSLMVNQLNGLFKIKNAKIRELVFKIRLLEGEVKLPIIYIHIYREKNQLADSLVKKALNSRKNPLTSFV
ncbi:ribonuclease HI family protein [Candidatus Roizmanbacteria bacterium]|nr:ribonuclease HI family protein [Candidatus Roizmanbacteria bacterium]